MMKTLLRISLVTATAILLYEVTNLLLIYNYFKFEYYIAGVAVIALVTGIILTKKHYETKQDISLINNPVGSLTNKELQILEQICLGKSNKEIASLNFIEVSTVKTHINNIYFKLGVNNRKEAMELYRQHLSGQKSTLSPPSLI